MSVNTGMFQLFTIHKCNHEAISYTHQALWSQCQVEQAVSRVSYYLRVMTKKISFHPQVGEKKNTAGFMWLFILETEQNMVYSINRKKNKVILERMSGA